MTISHLGLPVMLDNYTAYKVDGELLKAGNTVDYALNLCPCISYLLLCNELPPNLAV